MQRTKSKDKVPLPSEGDPSPARRRPSSSKPSPDVSAYLALGFLLVCAGGLAYSVFWARQSASTIASQKDKPAATAEKAAQQSARMERRVVVIGGGLAGGTAAIIAAEADPGLEVVLLEKSARLGGNSAKASSGINALNPAAEDTEALFAQDTLSSGGGLSKEELVEPLVGRSLDAITFLQSLGLELSQITQLGGHSKPRSRSNPSGANVGFAIMQAVIKKVKATPNIKVLEGATVQAIGADKRGRISSVTYAPATGEPVVLETGVVVLASGGFGASKQLLRAYSPVAAELATTNGAWATGDAVAWAQSLGAQLIHMEQVQVHPTGFVDPKDPEAGTKFLAPEKLRGVGAVLLNAEGRRFVDELATRDRVSDAIMAQTGRKAQVVLPEAAVDGFGRTAMQFYVSKGLATKVDDVSGLAALGGWDVEGVRKELQEYNEGAAAGTDRFGKRFFPSTLDLAAPLYVATITPVVHYTMGGLEINSRAEVLSAKTGQPIPGLYAAGEVSGGVHGRNRLGGNSLLECVVYGKIAGAHAAQLASPKL